MGFINSSRLKFSPDFQNTEEVLEVVYMSSCSAFINAVMKYLNSAAVVQSSRTLHAHLLKIALLHCNFSKNFTITAEQRYWKMHPDTCFWWQFNFGNFSEWLLLKDSCKDISKLHIFYISYCDVMLKRNEFLWIFVR